MLPLTGFVIFKGWSDELFSAPDHSRVISADFCCSIYVCQVLSLSNTLGGLQNWIGILYGCGVLDHQFPTLHNILYITSCICTPTSNYKIFAIVFLSQCSWKDLVHRAMVSCLSKGLVVGPFFSQTSPEASWLQ